MQSTSAAVASSLEKDRSGRMIASRTGFVGRRDCQPLLLDSPAFVRSALEDLQTVSAGICRLASATARSCCRRAEREAESPSDHLSCRPF